MILHEHEWRFDSIPNEQLIECCYYEYGRESAWLRRVNLHLVQSGRGTEFGFLHPASAPLPWQALNEVERSKIKRLQALPHSLSPFRLARWREAQSLYEACEAKAKLIHERSSDRLRAGSASTDTAQGVKRALAEISSIAPRLSRQRGAEVALFEINWRDFDDGEINLAFEQWVATNRPPGVGTSGKRGPKTKPWRASLERLGIMRLLHHYTFEEMTDALPTDFEVRAKYSNPSDCYAERKLALKDFRKLLPYAPKRERPLSSRRKRKEKGARAG